jgi:methionyl-tRNA formyltransferase
VAETARALGLDLDQPQDVNSEEARARIAAAAPEAVCVCAFGALIREPLLSAHPMLNVHPSLLPRWRGAAPVERAIMAGDEETGVSIMRLVAELDAGPVAAQAAEPIRADDTYGTLAARLEGMSGELLVAALDRFPPEFVAQAQDGVTYAEKIGPHDRRLDPARPVAELERTVRALHPHVGAQAALPDGSPLRIHEAGLAGATDVPAGLVERDGRLLFGAADGALDLRVVQPPGGRAMAASDFLRGRGLGQDH